MSIPNYPSTLLNDNLRKVGYVKSSIDCIVIGYKFFMGNMPEDGEYLGKGIRPYIFEPNSSSNDKFKTDLLDFVLKNDIPLNEAEISENNKFELEIKEIKLKCEVKGKRYIVESEVNK